MRRIDLHGDISLTNVPIGTGELRLSRVYKYFDLKIPLKLVTFRESN